MEFHIYPRDFNNRYHFSNIQVKGYFSKDKPSIMTLDSSQMRYYISQKNQNVHIDLNDGIKNINYDNILYDNESLDDTLRWIRYKNFLSSSDREKRLYPNFICRHRVLKRLLQTPFDNREWIICAVKWKDIIYLREFLTKDFEIRKQRAAIYIPPFTRKKFKQYLVSDTVNGSLLANKSSNGDSQFHCIFQSNLNNHVLLYSAEMDALSTYKVLKDPLPLEKLKFMMSFIYKKPHILGKDEMRKLNCNFRSWTSCSGTTINSIVYGFMNEKGRVKKLETYSFHNLQKNLKFYGNTSAALNFSNNFLTYVTNTVVDDYNQTIYKFEKIVNGDIEMTEVLPFSEYSFLPEWYIQNTV